MFLRRNSPAARNRAPLALLDPARTDLKELLRLLAVEPLPELSLDADAAGRRLSDASDELSQLLWAVVRSMRPTRVVEIGVSRGRSSAVILAALEANGGEGELWSIDMPGLGIPESSVGSLVPSNLRHRWTLLKGPSSLLLPGLLERLGTVDLFVHDGDHSAITQRVELEAALPFMGAKGVVVMDDLASGEFVPIVREQGLVPMIVTQHFEDGSKKDEPLGIAFSAIELASSRLER